MFEIFNFSWNILYSWIYKINPIAFSFFGIDFYWYGIAYLSGFLLGYTYLKKFFLGGNAFDIDRVMTYVIIGVLIGGRLGYLLLYDHKALFNLEFFTRGGMSFHGALAGVGIACMIIAWLMRVSVWYITDLVSVAAPIGIFFGRIANGINQEILGKITSDENIGVWYHRVDVFGILRHPISIYEALLEGLLLLFIIFFIYKKYYKHYGVTTGSFAILYAITRYICEFAKDDPIMHIRFLTYDMFVTYGQYLSYYMIAAGIALIAGRIFIKRVAAEENEE